MSQIKHNLKVRKLGQSSEESLKVNEHPISNKTGATKKKGQKGLPVAISAIEESYGGKPEDS